MHNDQSVLLQTAPGPVQQVQSNTIDNEHVQITHSSNSLTAFIKSPSVRIEANWHSYYISFRIGAATAAAQAGVEDSVIQLLGRWSSAAFLAYIRTPREDLARYSSVISHVP